MKTLMKFALITSAALSGCAYNGSTYTAAENVPSKATESVEKVFALLEGSMVYIGDGWYLTAAHNWPIFKLYPRDFIEHETCDIALYHSPLNDQPGEIEMGIVYFSKPEIYVIGYPAAWPTQAKVEGQVFVDVHLDDTDCRYTAYSGFGMGGMSGGGVFSKETDRLVGIYTNTYIGGKVVKPDGQYITRANMFVPLNYVSDWIFDNTGKRLIK